MNLLLSLRSELIKLNRTSALYLCLVVAALMPVLLLIDHSADSEKSSLIKDPWNIYFLEGWQGLVFVLFPMFIMLVCTLLPQMEYKNNTWKQVLSSPQSIASVFFSKFIIIHILIIVFMFVFNFLMVVSVLLLDYFNPAVQLFKHNLDLKQFLVSNAKLYLSILSLSAIQFWAGMRFKNFIVPIGIGLVFWIASGMLVFEYKWANVDLFPFAYPILNFLPKYDAIVPSLVTKSLIFTTIFLLLAFADFSGRKARG